jgi:hypothetical protein
VGFVGFENDSTQSNSNAVITLDLATLRVGNQSSLRVQHRATTHPITPARTQRPAHEGSIRPRAYPIRPGLSLSFTDPRVRPRTARSAHALVRPVSSIPSLSLSLSFLRT